MSISYKKLLFILKERGINSNTIKQENLISQATLQNIKNGYSISISSLSRLCARLRCQPGELLEWIDDGKHNENPKSKKGKL